MNVLTAKHLMELIKQKKDGDKDYGPLIANLLKMIELDKRKLELISEMTEVLACKQFDIPNPRSLKEAVYAAGKMRSTEYLYSMSGIIEVESIMRNVNPRSIDKTKALKIAEIMTRKRKILRQSKADSGDWKRVKSLYLEAHLEYNGVIPGEEESAKENIS